MWEAVNTGGKRICLPTENSEDTETLPTENAEDTEKIICKGHEDNE